MAAVPVAAHGVGEADAGFIEANEGLAIGPFLYLGAKHMITGYDPLLFLVGVVFFLSRLKDVAISSPCSRSATARCCLSAPSAESMPNLT